MTILSISLSIKFPSTETGQKQVRNRSETDNSDHSQNIVLPSGLLLDISIHTTQKLGEYFDHLIFLFMAWCLRIDDMHFHHRTVMQQINDLCQCLLVANTVEMFMWQIPFPLSIEVWSSFLHTGPFFQDWRSIPDKTGQKQTQFRPFSAHSCIDPFPGAIPNALKTFHPGIGPFLPSWCHRINREKRHHARLLLWKNIIDSGLLPTSQTSQKQVRNRPKHFLFVPFSTHRPCNLLCPTFRSRKGMDGDSLVLRKDAFQQKKTSVFQSLL